MLSCRDRSQVFIKLVDHIPIVATVAAIVIIFVSGVFLSVCAFSRWREAPGKTYVEKCLFFIRQMETDAT